MGKARLICYNGDVDVVSGPSKRSFMKLLYTEISYSMTEILVKEARAYADKGYRVFYIAPNSLSFEKERSVLALLPEQGSFAIAVTRFEQMARYFTLAKAANRQALDDNGLAMIFYRVLMQLQEDELKVFHRLRTDQAFIAQLVELYKELQAANLTAFDLTTLDRPEKQEDLITIMTKAEQLIAQGDYDQSSRLAQLAEAIKSKSLDDELRQTVLVIDGFTRFSAEEEQLLALLNEACEEIVIGAYISQKAYRLAFTKGNLYEASLAFIQQLAQQFQTKPIYTTSEKVFDVSFSRLTQLLEANHDYSQLDWQLSAKDKSKVVIWQALNQKEELEHVTKAIREKLYQGYRYKDMLVLLGDVASYQLQIGPIFEKFEIPYYIGKQEPMSAHPLVQFVESLERGRRYNWRREDIVNLLKSGLFGRFQEGELDQLEQYLVFADIQGFTKFSRPFTLNSSRQYPLPLLNQLRLAVVTPLQQLFKSQKQLGASLLDKLMTFFKTIQLADNFEALAGSRREADREKDEEVWKTFTGILETFYQVFGQEKMTLADCLALIKMGMQTAHYRTVPATLDVVSIKSYDLVEPHSKPFVFAIGLSRSHFPKQTKNTSLISDQERASINEQTASYQRLDVPSFENIKKNHQTALSLFNAATQELVLSLPTSLTNSSDDVSPYLKELIALGVPVIEKGKNRLSHSAADIGNYKALLSRLVAINRQGIADDMTSEDRNFWTVALRYLKRRLADEQLSLPAFEHHLTTKPVAPEVIETRFSSQQPLSLSSSALTVFYNNQYKYFLKYVLGLQEPESIHPDARIHGQYLHRIFELVTKDRTDAAFDQKLGAAIAAVNQQSAFQQVYQADAEGRYSLEVLKGIAYSTAPVLNLNQGMQVAKQEEAFELALGHQALIRGVIDRIDQLADGRLGIVDYKSSARVFDIGAFYNGLSPQLVTYLAALKNKGQGLFGAMYLHMQEPRLSLSDFKVLDDQLVAAAYKELTYKGIFLAQAKEYLANGSYHLNNTLYETDELETLLAYNEQLYLSAVKQIKTGHFLINPYTADGKSVQGDQLKAITRFEADLDLGYARRLVVLPAKERRQAFLTRMNEEIKHED